MTAFRTKSYDAADLEVTEALHAAAATDTLASAFTDGDLVTAILDLPRVVTITRAAAIGAYTTDPYTITGRRGGSNQPTTALMTPTDADGGDVLRSTVLFDDIESITIPAQATTGGSHSFGVGDIGCPKGTTFSAVELHADGQLYVQYGEPSGPRDSISVVIANRPYYEICPTRVVTDAATSDATTVGLTVYLDP